MTNVRSARRNPAFAARSAESILANVVLYARNRAYALTKSVINTPVNAARFARRKSASARSRKTPART